MRREEDRARWTGAAWLAAALAALAAAPAGCLRSPSFGCERDSQCIGKTAGRCESGIGYCAFSDGTCLTGFRYGEYSGPYSSQCVGEPGGDGGVDAPDAAIDAPVGCPASYAALPGIATHVYRLLTTAETWTNQRTACASDRAYLVEPGDAAELAAVNTLAGSVELWVGITDEVTEGTFLTSRGGAVVFLPWEAGQPDNQPAPQADCVRSSPTGTYADDKCNANRRAVCECEP